MSFALEFRKRHFLQPDRLPQERHRPSRAETRAARRGALAAFLLAAGILAAFNSEGLRSATLDLAETRAGRGLIALSKGWDGAMERAGAKDVVAGVREVVQEARSASWSDVAGLVEAPVLALRRTDDADMPADQTFTGALPASAGAAPPRAKAKDL